MHLIPRLSTVSCRFDLTDKLNFDQKTSFLNYISLPSMVERAFVITLVNIALCRDPMQHDFAKCKPIEYNMQL